MPNNDSHTEKFNRAVDLVRAFLKEEFPGKIKALSSADLKKFGPLFARGWRIKDVSRTVSFNLLLPVQFPYATPRIALEDSTDPDRDFSKEWPHVENQGILCLTSFHPSNQRPIDLVNTILNDALELIKKFDGDAEAAHVDFADEFISYWGRAKSKKERNILSLLNPDSESTGIFVAGTADGLLVARSSDEIYAWCANHYPIEKKPSVTQGIFVNLDEPPIAPFPSTIKELEDFLQVNAPEMLEVLHGCLMAFEPLVVVMSAVGHAGSGLIAICISRNNRHVDPARGFRGPAFMSAKLKVERLSEVSKFTRHAVTRVDHDWIHGRGKDTAQDVLKTKQVMVFGCGALGSHVAVRLAQAGVGTIYLVDPEDLETANVGRHALGVRHIGAKKSDALAFELRTRFPHLKIVSLPGPWEAILPYDEKIKSPDFIVSTIGEWNAEGPLNEWHVAQSFTPSIVYGWLEPRGAVAHALLVKERGSCLQCVVDDKGGMRYPHTTGWPDETGLESEPACGSVFQPFGPVDLAYAEALVSELAIGALLEKYEHNTHMFHTTSQNHIDELNGVWTDHHRRLRPEGFLGSFQAEESFTLNADCPFCSRNL